MHTLRPLSHSVHWLVKQLKRLYQRQTWELLYHDLIFTTERHVYKHCIDVGPIVLL